MCTGRVVPISHEASKPLAKITLNIVVSHLRPVTRWREHRGIWLSKMLVQAPSLK